MDIFAIAAQLRSADDVRMSGVGRAGMRAAVASGRLICVHRGWYVMAAPWNEWYPEQKHAAKTIAAVRSARGGDVVPTHTSAAVLHDLPLYRFSPAKVHVSGPGASGNVKRAASIARHRLTTDGDLEEVNGTLTTSLARTVADVVGRLPLATAVATADAALRKVAWVGTSNNYDRELAEAFRCSVLAHSALHAGMRGSVQGRWVMGFADGRAQLPGESVSRLLLHRLGFAAPRLQVRVAHSSGYYDIDFGLDDVDVWGEFDGTGKYTDPAMLGDTSTAEAVMKEKVREDDIRGRTRRSLIRWGSAHIATLEAFRTRLEAFHVRAPGTPGLVPPTFRGPKL